MNLINILYEPHFIIIVISLIITLITYFIIRKDPKDPKTPKDQNNSKVLLYTFLISFILLMICKYSFSYMNKNNFFQKGGDKVVDSGDNLTIMADDVDIGILED